LEEPYGAKDLVRHARKVCPECDGKKDFLSSKKKKPTLKSKAKKKSIHDSPDKSSVESPYEFSDEEIRVNGLHNKRRHDKLSF